MTPEIKKRIEQIQRGEVPEGYKRTKVGIVPYEWSCAKMSDMFYRLNRKNKVGNTNVLTISAQHGLISQEKFFNKSVASEDKSNYFLLKRGNFAYNKSYSNGYPFGAIKCLTAYDSGIVSPLYICFEPAKENQCPEYFAQYFDGGFLNREIHAVAQEGARNHGLLNIGVDDFFSLNITVPPLAEQKKIAEILAAQDRVIELYQRKIDEIKKLKKICLSKMFPQKGHNAPEIRFPEFTDAWEQRMLGDEFVRVNERNEGSFGINHWISVAKMYFQAPEKVTSNNLDTRTYVMRVGDIAFEGHSNAEFEFGRFVANDIGDGIISELFPIYRHKNEYYNPYWKYAIQIERIMRPVFAKAITSSGASSNKLNEEHFLRESILVPSLAEQVKLGDYFASLDNLITLNQRKLEELQKSKKALMQLLLTGIVRVKL